jgi:hypothetical protein
MAIKRLVLGEWVPDQPGLTGALTEAKNVVPRLTGMARCRLPKPYLTLRLKT